MKLASEIGVFEGKFKVHSFDEDGNPIISFTFVIPTKEKNRRLLYTAMGVEE